MSAGEHAVVEVNHLGPMRHDLQLRLLSSLTFNDPAGGTFPAATSTTLGGSVAVVIDADPSAPVPTQPLSAGLLPGFPKNPASRTLGWVH